MRRSWSLFVLAAVILLPLTTQAQNRFQTMPGYDQFEAMGQVLGRGGALSGSGSITSPIWSEDGNTLFFQKADSHFKGNLRNLRISEISEDDFPTPERPAGRGMRSAGRARQLTEEPSPDGKWEARHVDFNVVLFNIETEEVIPVTKQGTERFRYGTACWVYGEELGQPDAMWWSPDSQMLGFYEMDERHCKVFYLAEDLIETYPILNTEKYPKAGEDNPIAGLLVYNLETGATSRIYVGGDPTQYIYDIRWSPDGSELLFNRTNRHQNHLDVMAADPVTGASRIVVSETQETWQENSPTMRFLEDGQRFIWATEKNGFLHYELRHIDGSLINTLSTPGDYPCGRFMQIDEDAGLFYYTARSGDHPLNDQLHRVSLNGRNDTRLTSRELNHSVVSVAPDHKWFVARYEAIDTPPTTVLFNDKGEEVLTLSEFDMAAFNELGLTMPEAWSFTADDGETTLYGSLLFPANFDPSLEYPLLLSLYGGPGSVGISNTFRAGNAMCEFGFIMVSMDYRGGGGRGKEFLGEGYLKLGIVEIKDHADGITYISQQRSYIDGNRVGLYGHSYGGYMTALALVKYPDVFHVGVSGAPVTDWKNYDTIYTERYMRTPQENPDGYRDGSCMTYASQLKGKLLIVHGLIDDNVHPQNTFMLIEEFHKANVPFDIQVFPTSRHGIVYRDYYNNIRNEYLIDHLKPEPIKP